jgi:hypothetical protein
VIQFTPEAMLGELRKLRKKGFENDSLTGARKRTVEGVGSSPPRQCDSAHYPSDDAFLFSGF